MESCVVDAMEEAVEKSVHDEAASGVSLDATSLHVEEFLLAYRAVRGSVGAADFVVEDFQAGHGVRIGIIAEDEVANFLIGVSAFGSGFDFDETCKDGAGFVVEGIEVEEVA